MPKLVKGSPFSVSHTPSADIPAGSVVVFGSLVGIARRDIKANSAGELDVTDGEFEGFVGDAEIPAGTEIFWDSSKGQASADPAGGKNKRVGKSVTRCEGEGGEFRLAFGQA